MWGAILEADYKYREYLTFSTYLAVSSGCSNILNFNFMKNNIIIRV